MFSKFRNYIKKKIPHSHFEKEFYDQTFIGNIIYMIYRRITVQYRPLSSAPPEIQRKARTMMYGSVANMQRTTKEIAQHEKAKASSNTNSNESMESNDD